MKISTHTQISPRIEVDFVEQWIENNLNFGIDKIYLYNLGNKIFYDDRPCFITISGVTNLSKLKRPYLEYDKRTDSEINELWNEIMNKYKSNVVHNIVDVESYMRKKGQYTRHVYDTIQADLCFKYINFYENEKIDWLFNIDSDEFLSGDINYFNVVKSDIGQIGIKQIYYPERWFPNGEPNLNFLSLSPINGNKEIGCIKNVVRPEAVIEWKNVHYGVKMKNVYKKIVEDKIYFKHFRIGANKNISLIL